LDIFSKGLEEDTIQESNQEDETKEIDEKITKDLPNSNPEENNEDNDEIYDIEEVIPPELPKNEIQFIINNNKLELISTVETEDDTEDKPKEFPQENQDIIEKEKLLHYWEVDPNELEFHKKIGEGTFCIVYLGSYRGQSVAIKVLKTMNRKQIRSFKSELDIISNFRSPNVVYFYGACVDPIPILVLGYCERGSLYDVMNNEDELSWEKIFDMAYQVSCGLNSLHSWRPQIVHRDLKSKNILVENNWHIRLCDFGESRFAITDNVKTLTKMCGTYAYVSPEVYFGKPFSPKSDIYALGVILWEMAYRVCRGKYQRPFAEYKQILYDFQIIIAAAKKIKDQQSQKKLL